MNITWTKVTEEHYDAHTKKNKIFLGSIQRHKKDWCLLRMIEVIKCDKDIDKLKEHAKIYLIDDTRNYGKAERRTKRAKT